MFSAAISSALTVIGVIFTTLAASLLINCDVYWLYVLLFGIACFVPGLGSGLILAGLAAFTGAYLLVAALIRATNQGYGPSPLFAIFIGLLFFGPFLEWSHRGAEFHPYSHLSAFSRLGLYNPNNDCFFNAALQVLMRLPKAGLLPAEVLDAKFQENDIARNLGEFIALANNSTLPVLQALALRQSVVVIGGARFPMGRQEDSSELLAQLIASIAGTSVTDSLQSNLTYSSGYAMGCPDSVEPRTQSMSILPLNLPEAEPREQLHLKQLIDHTYSPEVTERRCESTGRNDFLRRETTMTQYPDALITTLSRFINEADGSAFKMLNKVEVPLTGLSFFGKTYRLHGVVYHMGSTLNSGHYTAAVRDAPTAHWVYYDDSRTKVIADPNEAPGEIYIAAYLADDAPAILEDLVETAADIRPEFFLALVGLLGIVVAISYVKSVGINQANLSVVLAGIVSFAPVFWR